MYLADYSKNIIFLEKKVKLFQLDGVRSSEQHYVQVG
jgi:hypothetical protein